MSENIFKTLGDYVKEVIDKDGDGAVSFKEILGLFPNNAVAIAFLVVDILVLVAEYRVWNVGMTITNGDPYRALGFVLVSALPFYLAQVLWLYPRATGLQRWIAILMGAGGLLTSAQFGLADLSQAYNVGLIVDMVIWLSVGYVVLLLVYVVTDKTVQANRMKAVAHAQAQHQSEINKITRSVLSDLRASLEEEQRLKRDFDPEAVQAQLDRLRGGKGKPYQSKDNSPSRENMPVFDTQKPQFSTETTQDGTWLTLQQFCAQIGTTPGQARAMVLGCKDHDEAFKRLVIDRSMSDKTNISGKNFRNLYYRELNPRENPQLAAAGNGRSR
jgi:hypothetical protein